MAAPGKRMALFLIALLVFFLGVISTEAAEETTENLSIHPLKHDVKMTENLDIHPFRHAVKAGALKEVETTEALTNPFKHSIKPEPVKEVETTEALGHSLKHPMKEVETTECVAVHPIKKVETTENVAGHHSRNLLDPGPLKEVKITENVGNPLNVPDHLQKKVQTTIALDHPFRKVVEITENVAGHPFKKVETSENVSRRKYSRNFLKRGPLKEVKTTEALGNPLIVPDHLQKKVQTTEALGNPFKKLETTENVAGHPYRNLLGPGPLKKVQTIEALGKKKVE